MITKKTREGIGKKSSFLLSTLAEGNKNIFSINAEDLDFTVRRAFKKEALFAAERVNSAQNYWKQGLAHQISGLPDFKEVIKECKELVYKRL